MDERADVLTVRQGVLQPISAQRDIGAMITVIHGGGLGYAATSDLSGSGLHAAIQRARDWAERTAVHGIFDTRVLSLPDPIGTYQTHQEKPWESLSTADKIALLTHECARLKSHDAIVDWSASLWRTRAETLYITSGGGRVDQVLHMLAPDMSVTANREGESQTRSLGPRGESQQGGLEILERIRFFERAPELGEEVIELLEAPNCPTGTIDLLLAPDQMMLQIHESIGHPLELDRILGDERNLAGTTFVTQEMLGTYEYGSDLLNVSYDPTVKNEFATYAFDDDGAAAERVFLIEKGILKRPLGGAISQARAGLSGVANCRATSWNRPPIDRMANLNVEPGDSTFEQLVKKIERGVFMATNCSWSIDDSRNKFQFGCEYGRVIEDGRLGHVVKNPNYRGVSATFWRSLSGVGDGSTVELCGSPYCGKGEPNQIIRVGHASPACTFSNVEVFGGEG